MYFELVGLVFSPFTFIFKNLARTLPPATLGHHRFCFLSCCGAAVVLVWCVCGGFDGGVAAAVAFV